MFNTVSCCVYVGIIKKSNRNLSIILTKRVRVLNQTTVSKNSRSSRGKYKPVKQVSHDLYTPRFRPKMVYAIVFSGGSSQVVLE